jgi:hypothetical protein
MILTEMCHDPVQVMTLARVCQDRGLPAARGASSQVVQPEAATADRRDHMATAVQ